jgi:hypothetical protein
VRHLGSQLTYTRKFGFKKSLENLLLRFIERAGLVKLHVVILLPGLPSRIIHSPAALSFTNKKEMALSLTQAKRPETRERHPALNFGIPLSPSFAAISRGTGTRHPPPPHGVAVKVTFERF